MNSAPTGRCVVLRHGLRASAVPSYVQSQSNRGSGRLNSLPRRFGTCPLSPCVVILGKRNSSSPPRVVLRFVPARRPTDLITVLLASLTCLLFALSLQDTPPSRLMVRAALAPAVPHHSGHARVRVHVRDEATRAPLPNATVHLFWEQTAEYFDAGSGRTDATGTIELEGVPEGNLWVLAEAPGFARASSQLTTQHGVATVELELGRAHELAISVRTETGEPIPAATVLIHSGDALPFGAVTAEEGTVRVRRLPAPTWSVRVSARGFESVTRHDVGGSLSVVLRRLAALRILVLASDGTPAPGAEVWLSGAALWPSRRASTGQDGSVTVLGLLGGIYELRAARGDQVSSTLFGLELSHGQDSSVTIRLGTGRRVPIAVYDAADPLQAALANADVLLVEHGISPFPLRGRTNAEGRIVLGPVRAAAFVRARADGFVPSSLLEVPQESSEPLRIGLLRGGILRGRVVDERGFPVAGASIEVIGSDLAGMPLADTPWSNAFRDTHFEWSLAGPLPLVPAGELGVMPGAVPPIPRLGYASDVPGAAPAPVQAWVTRDTGYFAVQPVTPGRVRALVRHPSYLPGVSDVVPLGPGQSAEVTVALRGGVALDGRLLDERDLPVAGARIDIQGQRGLVQKTTFTAADGTFAFAAVPAHVVLSVSRPENPHRPVLRRDVDTVVLASRELELTLPDLREDSELLVVDDMGRPLAGAQILLASLDPAVPIRQTLFTGEDGRALIPDVRGLEVSVTVERDGYAAARRTFDSAPAEARFALKSGLIVVGQVTAVRGRRYVAGADVILFQSGRRRAAVTDEVGSYRFVDVEPGAARLRAVHPDYAAAELSMEIVRPARADTEVELPELDLPDGAAVSGVVVDMEGQVVPGARVGAGAMPDLVPAGGGASPSVAADERGAFRLTGLQLGKVLLQARADGVGRGTLAVDLVSGGELTAVQIVLAASGASGDGDETDTAAASLAISLREGPNGIAVAHVAVGSEAERAGLQAGDIIKRIDGISPRGIGEARARLGGTLGSHLLVDLIRDGAVLSVRVVREAVRP